MIEQRSITYTSEAKPAIYTTTKPSNIQTPDYTITDILNLINKQYQLINELTKETQRLQEMIMQYNK